jgi:4-amino-4-deoxy-L-arabinose transferase-like glycosyltransferase
VDVKRATWVSLMAILLLATGLRLASVITTPRPNGFDGVDPDGYGSAAIDMVVNGHWRWNADVVDYVQFTKPPLYPVLLSLFVLASPEAYPVSAVVGHALANAAIVFIAFWIGRTIQGDLAGLVAAGLFAIYLPAVTGSWVFVQENFYLPAVLAALGLLVQAWVTNARPRSWLVTGVVFGFAALIRSMPVYFLPAALLLYVAGAVDRRAAVRRSAALLVGFALLVVPYSAYISARKGQFILIENMATIRARITYPSDGQSAHTAPPPGLIAAATMFARGFLQDPAAFTQSRLDDLGGMFQLRGGRWLQLHAPVADSDQARRLKALAHASIDLPLLIAAMLAPFGWAFARRRPGASVIVLWIAVNVLLVTAAGMSGARYRAPIEAPMMVLAAVVLTGGWRRINRWQAAAAILATVGVGLAIANSVPSDLRGEADYGLVNREGRVGWRASVPGTAGFNVLSTAAGLIEFSVSPRADGDASPVFLDISIDRQPVNQVRVLPGETRSFHFSVDSTQLAYVEIAARPRSGGARPWLDLLIPPPQP